MDEIKDKLVNLEDLKAAIGQVPKYGIATVDEIGVSKPDGESIDIEPNGTLSVSESAFIEVKEGQFIHADDAFASKPLGAMVYGSTRNNLWRTTSGTSNGVTVAGNEDGTVSVSGVSTAVTTIHNLNNRIFSLKPSTTYTASIDKEMVPTARFGMREYDSSGSTLGILHEITTSGVTFTTDKNMAYVIFRFDVGADKDASGTYRVMLNEGETAETWSKPGISSVTGASLVTAGKNVLDVSGAEKTGWNVVLPNARLVHGETYTYTAPKSNGKVALIAKANDMRLSSDYMSSGAADTFTVPSSADFSQGLLLGGDTESTMPDAESAANSVMVELGSSATAYEPPSVSETPIDLKGNELRGVGVKRDAFDIQSGMLAKFMQKVVFDGSDDEKWTRLESANYTRFYLKLDGSTVSSYVGGETSICDVFPLVVTAAAGAYGYNINGGGLYVNIGDKAATLESFMALLAKSPATLVYTLDEPQEIQLDPLDIPELPAPIFNAWTDSDVPCDLGIRYANKRASQILELAAIGDPDVATNEEAKQYLGIQ